MLWMYQAIHKTRALNEIQMDPEAQLPNMLHWLTYRRQLTVLICLICHLLSTGNRQYASDTLDLKTTEGSTGFAVW